VHRSRLSMLVIFAAAAACSTRDDAKGTTDDSLSKDPTLVAKLEASQRTRPQPLPDACGTVAVVAPATSANKAQADELTRRAYDAEMQGNVQEARSLLRRASDLDATNKSAAYHLGLTSETLGDRATAVSAYCRYLSLAPASNESAEARQRVTKLSQTTQVAAGSVGEAAANGRAVPAATTRRETRVRPAAEPRVVASGVARSATPSAARREPVQSPARVEPKQSPVRSEEVQTPPQSEPVVVAREGVGAADSAKVGGEVVAASRPAPPVEQPPAAPPTVRRGPNRAQSAGIGAAVGGIIGAATGRSVKSAIIGAAAGGIFGTAVGGTIRPISGGGI
jgi:Flp pilus assembly protein TadD